MFSSGEMIYWLLKALLSLLAMMLQSKLDCALTCQLVFRKGIECSLDKILQIMLLLEDCDLQIIKSTSIRQGPRKRSPFGDHSLSDLHIIL